MHKKHITQLWAFALSAAAVFGGMGCLISGFNLSGIGFWTALSWILTAVVFCLCIPRKMTLYPVVGLVLLGAGLWWHGYLSGSAELLLREISAVYDSAYGCGVIGWSDGVPLDGGVGTALCWMGLPIVILWCYAVIRRSLGWLAVLLAVLPLGCCMVVTDTVPQALPLGVLLFAILLLLMTQMVRRRDEAQGNRLLALLTLPVALGLVLLFLLIPQEGYSRQDGAQRLEEWVLEWFQGDFGFSEPTLPTSTAAPSTKPPEQLPQISPKQENLSLVGPKVQSDMRVMTVLSEKGGVLYLRGTGFDRYSGTEWVTDAQEVPQLWPGQALLQPEGSVEISTILTQSIQYLPYYVSAEVYGKLENGSIPQAATEKTYLFAQVGSLPVQALMADGADAAQLEPWLQLPEQTLLWAEPVLNSIFGTAEPPADLTTVYAIAEYVRASAKYDLNTPRMGQGYTDFAQWFLEGSDTGYCVHFATATAVLLRAAGIPSRYVTGYMVTAQAGEKTTVTGKQAHAWVEFCLPGSCWYPLESTPAQENGEPMPTLPEIHLPEETQAPEILPEHTQATEDTEPSLPLPSNPAPQTPEAPKPGLRVPGWLLAAAFLLVLALAQWRLRVHMHSSAGHRGKSKRKALERWQQHARMARLLGESVDRELLELAQKAKFSPHPITAEELTRFTRVTRQQISRLKKQPWYLQLYYTLILALY